MLFPLKREGLREGEAVAMCRALKSAREKWNIGATTGAGFCEIKKRMSPDILFSF